MSREKRYYLLRDDAAREVRLQWFPDDRPTEFAAGPFAETATGLRRGMKMAGTLGYAFRWSDAR